MCLYYVFGPMPKVTFSSMPPLSLLPPDWLSPKQGLPVHRTTLFLSCDRFLTSYFIPDFSTQAKSTKSFTVPTFQHGINALLCHRRQPGRAVGGLIRHSSSTQFCFLIPAEIPAIQSTSTWHAQTVKRYQTDCIVGCQPWPWSRTWQLITYALADILS